MGNYFYKNVNLEKDILDILPKDMWMHIAFFLPLADLGRFSQVSKNAKNIFDSNLIWKHICKKEKNFNLIKTKKQELELNWKKAFLTFQTAFIKTTELLIGNPFNPEARMLLQLLGNGKCYISEKSISDILIPSKLNLKTIDTYYVPHSGVFYEMVPINYYLFTEENELHNIKKNIPYTNDNQKMKLINTEKNKLKLSKIINFVTFDSYVLLITDANKIFDFIITPSWISYSKLPSEVILPIETDDEIMTVKALPLGNFVIININPNSADYYNYKSHQKIIFWTYICEGKTPPKIIEALSEYNIYDINQISNEETEIFYYKSNGISDILKVKNVQILVYAVIP